MRYARRVERGRRVENELEPSWRGALVALIWSPWPGHVQRDRFSRPRSREPKGGNLDNLAGKEHRLVSV